MFNNLNTLTEQFAGKFNFIVVADSMTAIPIRTFDTLEEMFNTYPGIEITATELSEAGFGDYKQTELWIYG